MTWVTNHMKHVFITGGTGSLGNALVARLLHDNLADEITIFSRDELKQHNMRLRFGGYANTAKETDEIIYRTLHRLHFVLGDVRDFAGLRSALMRAQPDVIIHAAALKQVPTAEYEVEEVVKTNVQGSLNLLRAVQELRSAIVVGCSTDKACSPCTAYGMTKALMERAFIEANLRSGARFSLVRYGNVIGSRGSVIPLWREQWSKDQPLTLTDERMTRFWLTLGDAVDLVLRAVAFNGRGTILVPQLAACAMVDLARVVTGGRYDQIDFRITGIRPAEKLHEVLVDEREASRTHVLDHAYVIAPLLPEVQSNLDAPLIEHAYTSDLATKQTDLLTIRDLLERADRE